MAAPGMYSIGALARMLGISPATLRSWEDRYGVVVPERSSGSQRLYSRDHLDQLLFVSQRMQEGFSAADAHRALADRLSADPEVGAGGDEPQSRERSILLVERDPYAAELAEYFLRTEGYDVCVARTIAEAQQQIDRQPPDLAIVDLMIGGGAGLRLCEHLDDRVPVLAVSVLDQHDRALAAGADAFIRKPFDSLALVSATRDLVGTSAILREANRVLPT
ncbi:MAG: MerR family transcriptional regulator, light-induced transcriptional regulator [Gaiellaceae bacterium]|nr:MerR family transcriptional regulator, light-induced transcriptional regulator [Gaiellaceae bacterium]